MDAVSDRMFTADNPFERVRGRCDLNGLQKLQEAIRLNQSDEARTNLAIQSIPLTRNPRLLVEMIESNRRVLTPYCQELLEEGNRDGSLHTEYARKLRINTASHQSVAASFGFSHRQREGMKRKFCFLRRNAGEDGRSPCGCFDPGFGG